MNPKSNKILSSVLDSFLGGRSIDAFYIEQMARFMAKLKNTKTAGGNLLDETMVFFGSCLGDASRHSNRDLPIIRPKVDDAKCAS
jgi:hypothetical protein